MKKRKKKLPSGAQPVTTSIVESFLKGPTGLLYYVWKDPTDGEVVLTTLRRITGSWREGRNLRHVHWHNKSSVVGLDRYNPAPSGACEFERGKHLVFENYWLAYGYWQRLCNGKQ